MNRHSTCIFGINWFLIRFQTKLTFSSNSIFPEIRRKSRQIPRDCYPILCWNVKFAFCLKLKPGCTWSKWNKYAKHSLINSQQILQLRYFLSLQILLITSTERTIFKLLLSKNQSKSHIAQKHIKGRCQTYMMKHFAKIVGRFSSSQRALL